MHPIIVRVAGPIKIHSYGLMLALAFLTAIWLTQRAAKRKGIDPDIVGDVAIWLLVSGVLGARLMFVILNPSLFSLRDPLGVFKIWEGGLVFYGGVLAAVPVGAFLLRRKQVDVWHFADVAAPYIAFAHAIGRIGCFLNGCCFGKPSDVPWAVTFPKFVDETGAIVGSPVYEHQLYFCDPPLITANAARSLPVHPTQLYSALGLTIIGCLLLFLWKRRMFRGQIFWSYVLLYAVFRFFVEIFRADNPEILWGLTISQVVGIFLFLSAAVILVCGLIVSRAREEHVER
jgi:phosphatidylglycerol:prolipoprotein diacylglycerol transferase